jgi:hypothetical protein
LSSETGSLVTASSSGESANPRSLSTDLNEPRTLTTTGGIDGGDIRDLMIQSRTALRADKPAAAGDRVAVRQRLAIHRRRDPQAGPRNRPDAVQRRRSNGMAEAFVKTFKRDYARQPATRCRQRVARARLLVRALRHGASAQGARLPLDRASSGSSSWKRRPRTRSALGVDRMKAQCPRMRSGQARQPRAARRRAASGLTRAQPWTNRKNHSLSGYSGATT